MNRFVFLRALIRGAALLAVLWAASRALARPEPAIAASNAALTLGVEVIGEGDEFSTRVLGLPWWNFNGAPYPDPFTALKNIDSFSTSPDGFWEMQSVSSDPIIWLHWTGVGTTQRVLKMGDSYPIDASRYSLLSYYMCLDEAPGPTDYAWAANVHWMYDRSPHDDPHNGTTEFLFFLQQGRFAQDGDCELLTFDLSQPSAWMSGAWSNNPARPMGLRLDPINVNGAQYRIGWVRLTSKDTANVVPITWSGAPAGTQEFYASLDGCGQNGILIGSQSGTGGTFDWGAQVIPGYSAAHPLPLPESFEPGSYYIYMEDAAGGVACAANNPIRISAAPILAFQKPSFMSGPDFATTVLGDSWGMGNSADVEQFISVDQAKYENGVLEIVAEHADPRLYMNLDGQTIPTSQYRYVSFRFKINGTNSATSGWVQRWLWWYPGGPGSNSITTQDTQIYENWHVYTIDLKTAPTENCSANCWSGLPIVFRFDPFETPKPTSIEMDFVTLTGEERTNQGTVFPLYYTTTAGSNAVISFYYDVDKNPANGRTLIGSTQPSGAGPARPPEMSFALFLPLLSHADMSELGLYADSLRFNWDTTSAPPGTYYVCGEVYDGVMTTYWCSELPVTVQ